MSNEIVYVHKDKLTDLADAVRAKTGTQADMTLDEMKTAVDGIPSGSNDVLVPPVYPTPDVTETIT